ncbi:GNAT family N-acetyltransferase [Virgibacillus natechei]|uniref:GNAT family N-acetyltransferase n=1 Tax=Virgibacillus sp. CBA3643 TaxID=2942278 RepID=UPI0035A36EB0
MTIREATDTEIEDILNYAPVVIKEATVGYAEPRRDVSIQIASSFLLGGGYYLVHKENNATLGWIGVGETFNYYTDEAIGLIPEIYILPQYRQQGIATKLFKEAFKELKEKGYKKVQLNVFAGNHAKDLYHKLDFQAISTVMERDLDSPLHSS